LRSSLCENVGAQAEADVCLTYTQNEY